MSEPSATGQPSKWAQLVAAIDTMTAESEDRFDWGVMLFGAGDDSCSANGGIAVPPAPQSAAVIAEALAASGAPRGDAPTAAAVTAAGTYLRALADARPKFILLASDGLATCAGSDPAQAVTATEKAIAEALAAGVPTYVVGIPTAGDGTAAQTLDRMAIAGGHPRDGAVSSYTPVENITDLLSSPVSIGGAHAPCLFTLGVAPPSPTNVRVLADGKVVPPNDIDGWTYGPNTTTIVFHGSYCDDVRNNVVTNLEILFGCGDVHVP